MKNKKIIFSLSLVLLVFGCFSTNNSPDDNQTTNTPTTTPDTPTTGADTNFCISVSDVSNCAWETSGFPLIFEFPNNTNNVSCDSVRVQIWQNNSLLNQSCILAKGNQKKIYFTANGNITIKYWGKSTKSGYIGEEKSLAITIPQSKPVVKYTDIGTALTTNKSYTLNLSQSYDLDGSCVKYEVNWGDGTINNSTTTTSFSHTYTTEMTNGTIILSVYDNDGNCSQMSISISVASQKIASAFDMAVTLDGTVYTNDEISAQKIYAGDLIYLDASSSVASEEATIQSYKWEVYWENNWHIIATKSSGNRFSYALNWIGNAIIRLTITDSKDNNTSIERNLTVTNRKPTCTLEANVTEGYVPLTVSFTWKREDADTRIKKLGSADEFLDQTYVAVSNVSSSWKYDVSSSYEKIFTFENIGEQKFYLMVEDKFGGKAYDTLSINVKGADYSFDILNFDKTDNTSTSQSLTGDQLRFQFATSTPDLIRSQVLLGNTYAKRHTTVN